MPLALRNSPVPAAFSSRTMTRAAAGLPEVVPAIVACGTVSRAFAAGLLMASAGPVGGALSTTQ